LGFLVTGGWVIYGVVEVVLWMGIIRFWGSNLCDEWGCNSDLSDGWVGQWGAISSITQWGDDGLGAGYESSKDNELEIDEIYNQQIALKISNKKLKLTLNAIFLNV
jgi:hypothetical protein